MSDMAELMTVEELSKYLRLTKRTIYRLLRQGNMPAAKVGHRWRFDREAIDNWFRRGATGAYGRVLVIDDDPAIGRLFAGTLEERGYSVIALQTAHEAMELVQRTNFGHIFVDLDMPKIKEAEILRRIRAAQPDVPVTITSGYLDSEMMRGALEHGPLGVIKRPFGADEILMSLGESRHRPSGSSKSNEYRPLAVRHA